jgi:hypothetical protein
MLANDTTSKIWKKNHQIKSKWWMLICLFYFFLFFWSFLLGALDNLLPTVGIYNLFCAKLWIFLVVNSMIFCENSPRFEKRKSKKIATFLYMVQVGYIYIRSWIQQLESHFRGSLSNKKINMENKIKMDYPLEGNLTFTQEI